MSSLSPEQTVIFNEIVYNKQNVFFTGSAGTGKSYLLRHIISTLETTHSRGIYTTALTGIAAINIGGTTLHSFAGIGIGDDTLKKLYTKVSKDDKASKRWKACKVLIIDEISMLNAELFEILDKIARAVRKNLLTPFGGIQLILSGDFFQLPPIKGCFCFESPLWHSCIHKEFILTKVFRQTDDRLIKILNDIRFGHISKKNVKLLTDTKTNKLTNPVRLYATNAEVEYVNNHFLDKLAGKTHVYRADDTGNKKYIKLLQSCIAPTILTLKKGCSCIFLKNKPDINIVNGSLCTIIGFNEVYGYPIVRFKNKVSLVVEPDKWDLKLDKEVVARRTQVPLKLSYAVSIHKSMGLTLPELEVDLNSVFACGQVYVALSRATSFGGLRVMRLSADRIKVNKRAVKFLRELELKQEKKITQ